VCLTRSQIASTPQGGLPVSTLFVHGSTHRVPFTKHGSTQRVHFTKHGLTHRVPFTKHGSTHRVPLQNMG